MKPARRYTIKLALAMLRGARSASARAALRYGRVAHVERTIRKAMAAINLAERDLMRARAIVRGQ